MLLLGYLVVDEVNRPLNEVDVEINRSDVRSMVKNLKKRHNVGAILVIDEDSVVYTSWIKPGLVMGNWPWFD